MKTLGRDLERIVPDILGSGDDLDQETLLLHLERYKWAARFAKERRVLDLACGVGYGSALLATAGAQHVLGVDKDADAIAYAREHYSAPGLTFESHDAFGFRPATTFGLVVCLETIEHVSEPARLIERLASFLMPGGTFVGSVPVTISTDVNPFHLHDFTEKEFVDLVRGAGLIPQERIVQVQRFFPLRVLRRGHVGKRLLLLRPNLLRHYAKHPGLAMRRSLETLRYGFCNRYLVLTADKPAINKAFGGFQ
jgi:SAM-dependent methyltransferase